MLSTDAREFYLANKDREREYVPVTAARLMKKGAVLLDGVHRVTAMPLYREVEEDGYLLNALFNAHARRRVSPGAFRDDYADAGNFGRAVPLRPLPPGARAAFHYKPGRVGEEISPFTGRFHEAPSFDGVIVREGPGRDIYYSCYELCCLFNDASRFPVRSHEEITAARKGEVMKGIVLEKDEMLPPQIVPGTVRREVDRKGAARYLHVESKIYLDPVRAPAGSFLHYDEAWGEYMVELPPFAALHLRHKPPGWGGAGVP